MLGPRLSLGTGSRRAIAIAACILILSTMVLLYLHYAGFFGISARRAAVNAVGVIRVEGPILTPEAADVYIRAIESAVRNDTIKAVVLLIDSPGGEITSIERVYGDLLELGRRKPLIASVMNALSGGYYLAVAAEYIYVLPSSGVGNIGVIGQGPPMQPPSEQVLETGAYKLSGYSRLTFLKKMDEALSNFISAVKAGRGERLRLSEAELKRAEIYLGVEAISNGLADEIGSLQRAIERAAEKAGLKEYVVVDLVYGGEVAAASTPNQSHSAWRYLTIELLNGLNPPPAIYYLYLPPGNIFLEEPPDGHIASGLNGTLIMGDGRAGKRILIDVSHGNAISPSRIEPLAWELVRRGAGVRFVDQWTRLRGMLNESTALIIASPARPYSCEELDDIENFVNRGGMLILIYDPAVEGSPQALDNINLIANTFGLSFANGYLYDQEDYYGIYRNVYVRDFADSPITRGIGTMIFFTAAHVRSEGHGIAFTSEDAYSSTGERPGRYSVVALVEHGEGVVVAVGDMTFMMEPYCYLEDNYRFIANLAEYAISREWRSH